MGFQKDFMWGGSVSSMQTEGAYNEDGKGVSIYDVLPAKPDHSDWKTAIDSYHHYKEDNALFAGMHFNAYRFSVSWVRVLPDGEGEVNQKGLAFYDSFVNDLIEKGMEPVICLYHFDIPMKLLEKYGGWCSRKMVEAYENYARLIMEHFKGRVRYYIPFNEQNVASLVQMSFDGTIKKEEKDRICSAIKHHMFLAAAAVVHLKNEIDPRIRVGGMVNYMPVYPKTADPEDIMSAYKVNRVYNNQTLDVLVYGEYPKDLLRIWEKKQAMPPILENDLEYLKMGRVDFIAHSYYMSIPVGQKEAEYIDIADDVAMAVLSNRIHTDERLAKTQWGATVDPVGLKLSVCEMYERYRLPIFTVECGIGAEETADEQGYVDDQYRIDYLKAHITGLKEAVEEYGVDLMGFLTWGPIDLLSSSGEMRKRYGFIYVNRTDQEIRDLKRSKKKSYYWFAKVIESNGEEL